jgi:carbon monoxide dehydrogenase subunit G
LAINFSGDFTTPRTQDEVFDFLSDPNKFGPLLPDFQSMTQQDATHFAVKVRVGVGNIRGTAEIKMELAEAVKPVRAHYKGQGTAVGSQVTISAGFDLSPQDGSTKVAWQGEANIFGKLASMAGGMLEPLARKNIQRLIDGLQKALAESAAKPVEQQPEASTERAVSFISEVIKPQIQRPLPEESEPAASSGNPNRSTPVEAPGLTAVSSDTSQVQASSSQAPPVEAPGFTPANSDTSKAGALATDDSRVEGDHGNNNAARNS